MKGFRVKHKEILILDSTEKCFGTSLKHILRSNFKAENFFDVDNGDPPDEPIRGYGIQCPIDFPSNAKDLLPDQSNFYEIYDRYINLRSDWLIKNFDELDVECVYGNGVMFTPLYEFLTEQAIVRYSKFFREPTSRIISEYFYVLGHRQHNLHPIAASCEDIFEYVQHPLRPKNRQASSVTGGDETDGSYAFDIVREHYDFVGLNEEFDQHLANFCEHFELSCDETAHRNKTALAKRLK